MVRENILRCKSGEEVTTFLNIIRLGLLDGSINVYDRSDNVKIYKIMYNQLYEDWMYKEQYDLLFLNSQFRGEKFDAGDQALPLKLETAYKGERAEAGEISDIGNIGFVPIFKAHAKEIVEKYVKDLVEWVTFEHDEYGICYGMNVLKVVDCLDIDRCKFTPHHFNERYEMKKNIDFPLVFKIPINEAGGIFVTEAFKEIIESNQLKGLCFDPIWESK